MSKYQLNLHNINLKHDNLDIRFRVLCGDKEEEY